MADLLSTKHYHWVAGFCRVPAGALMGMPDEDPDAPVDAIDVPVSVPPPLAGAAPNPAASPAANPPAANPPAANPPVTNPTAAPPQPPSVDPEKIIRDWLDKHEFAPPETQPDGAGKGSVEQHVLLNGEDMALSDAVKAAVAGTQQPEPLVRKVITASLSPTPPANFGSIPFVGPGNQVPGLRLPSTGTGLTDVQVMKISEMSAVDDFLKAHDFDVPAMRDPAGAACLLDGKDTTVEAVADKAFAALGQYPASTRDEVLKHIRQQYVAARGGNKTQLVFGYTLVPDKLQAAPGQKTTQHQFSFTITRQHHANDSGGMESSFQGQVTLDESGRIMGLSAAGQEAIVKPLLEGWIQVSGLVQVAVNANWSRTLTGQTTVTGGWQVAAGGQILLTPAFKSGDFKFLNGHIQVGVQVLGGLQGPMTGPDTKPTPGISGGVVVNVPFDITDLFGKH
ncbi:MAG TPA: hypothetical protein VHB27_12345 [Rhodopila sp.]|uniref:hypothetical protein n=1 Tax=Rhodopila sp. TaxID=2480087 RepID=UPI002BD6D575|nr:hypothetical protein [Rhodopila sp.]HVY16009.1 hypothetical protein [Rhodopila sp.]